jgi:NADH:ubiquinone oxidoreductase subunit
MEVDLPRHQKANPYNYTKVQLAKRERDIKALLKDYPKVPPMWVEWMYDVVENMPKDEQERIINNGEWEKEGKFSKAVSGTFHNVELFNEDFTPYQPVVLKEIEN